MNGFDGKDQAANRLYELFSELAQCGPTTTSEYDAAMCSRLLFFDEYEYLWNGCLADRRSGISSYWILLPKPY